MHKKGNKIFQLAAMTLCCLAMSWVNCHATEIGEIIVKGTSDVLRQEALEQMVADSVASRVGTQFSPATLSDDIKKLVLNGKLDDVHVDQSIRQDGRIALTFTLTPKPIIARILIQGNKAYKEEKIRNKIEHATGVQLNDNQLAADRKAIYTLYTDAGYHGTEITTLKSQNPDGKGIDVTFVIKEEERFKLKKVYFANNTVFDESTLRSSIETQRQWWRYIIRFGNYFNKGLQPLDKDKLQKLYAEKGYMDFAVSDIVVKKVDDDKWVEVTYVLEEGQPYTIKSISLSGSELFTAEELLSKSTTKVGQIHDSVREELDINLMRVEYDRKGYLDMRFWATYNKNEADHTVDVAYHVIEGKPITIRNIEITGNTITKDEVARRELAISPGDLGDNSKIRISKARLSNLGLFSSVEVVPVKTDMPEIHDLRIELKEKPTGQIGLGAGFSTEDNAIAFLEFSETNFDLGKLLGFEWPPKGDGQSLSTRIQVGSTNSNFIVTHTEPWFLDRRLELTSEFFLRNRYEDEYDQRNIGGGMMLSWPLSFIIPGIDHQENWRMGIGFRLENVNISDVDKHKEEDALKKGDFLRDRVLRDEEGAYHVTRLLMRLSRDTRNTFLFPTRGSHIVLNGEFVSEHLGSYETYGRLDLEGTKYIQVFSDVIMKLDACYATNTGDKARIFDRYFGGGIGTIRGFRRRDVAPVDRFEDPYGGNSILTGSIEFIKPVKNFMYLCTFVDAGQSWWDDFKVDFGDMNYSVGFGVQFKQLPIRIYYGIPVHTTYDHLDGRSGRLHFNIGLSY